MNKIKFILPLTGLATVPAIVMPLTSCANSPFDLTLEGETLTNFEKPYDQQYGTEIRIQDAMTTYIDEFSNVNEAFARDIAYFIKKKSSETTFTKIEVLDCSFNKKEWQLSNHIKVTYTENNVTYTDELIVKKVRYSVNPHAEPSHDKGVYFSPIGVAGVILQDKNWSIQHKLKNADNFTTINYETSLKDWEDFWKDCQNYLCFVPYYYAGTKLK